ncbi:MAG: tetratricopeptide repeat protein [Anaerolineae bacterium]|nr:tetratricopeptide repeat protein [Anaerolineae bacterium]
MVGAIRRFINWLGPARSQAIFLLLAITGLVSLILNAVGQQYEGVRFVQSLLLVIFLAGTAAIVILRFPAPDRSTILLIIGPALIAVSLALLLPNVALFFLPVAIGWILITSISMRGRIRREYQAAIRHMRKGEYNEAIKVMSTLIDDEADVADHHRFRAELYRLSGKLKKARDDYRRVTELEPESGIGFNGLAEVYLQDGEYDAAIPFAQKALELEPNEWVPAYNLGMIEDRRGQAEAAISALQQALKANIPDSRHRLLAHLWIARAQVRQDDAAAAAAEVREMKREQAGLREWKTIFESEEAAVLKRVLLEDVELAEKLLEGTTSVESLKA